MLRNLILPACFCVTAASGTLHTSPASAQSLDNSLVVADMAMQSFTTLPDSHRPERYTIMDEPDVDGAAGERRRPDSVLLSLLPDVLPAPFTVRAYWENDGAALDPFDTYDRGYTNGLALTIDHQPQWAQSLIDCLPFAGMFRDTHGQPNAAVGYVVGQQMYTPRNIITTAPIPGDQPFAGYLYGGMFVQREAPLHGREDAAVLDHFEINLGVIGESSGAEQVQTDIHNNFSGDPPNGWVNQLRDEFAYQLYYKRKWRFDTGSLETPLFGCELETQVIPYVGLALGNVHRNAEVGVTARIGYRLPDDFGAGRINDLQSATGTTDTEGWAWYAWVRVGGRYVEHNVFLDGSNTRNPSPSVDKEPFIGEVQFGLSIAYNDGPYSLTLTWGLTFHTDDFDAGTTPNAVEGTTSYGTGTLTFTKRF